MAIVDHHRLTRTFFRGVTVPLFRRFFGEFGVWAAMGLREEATGVQVHAAWDELRCPQRDDIEEELRRVNDIGREKGRFALLYRAQECGVEGCRDLPPERLAMTLYLDHRAAFDDTYKFHMLEKTENLHTLLGSHPAPCDPSDEQIARFRDALSRTLREDAHGPHLLVELAPPHPKKWMAAIPHQTFAKSDFEFDERNEIITRDRRPVYEMILIYYPAKGVLKLKAGRGRKKTHLAAQAFATEVLGQDADFFQICDVVNFEPLLAPGFSFAPEPSDYFKWVRPTQMRFRRHANPGFEYHIHGKDRYDDAPNVLVQLAADGVSLSEIEVQSMHLCFRFPDGVRDRRTVELGLPNKSSLDETERDRYIERVLVRWEVIDHAARERLDASGLAG